MANVTYTVVKGDTLTKIANRYNTTVSALANLNNIENVDLIYVGQVLIVSGTPEAQTTNVSNKATIEHFGLQADTDRTVFATWSWDRGNTENYEVLWKYDTGDGVWFIGDESTTENKQSTYNAPSNAIRVQFKVKPISKKKTVNKKETSYWTAEWSTAKTYSFSENPPTAPGVPTVTIDKYKLTATLDNLNVNATSIEFQVVKNDSMIFATGMATISTGHASYSCFVSPNVSYKVRCRSVRGSLRSEWSEYSSNYNSIPLAPTDITTCRASSETSVYLEWTAVKAATSYDIEFTSDDGRYKWSSDDVVQRNNISTNRYTVSSLESGKKYYFRVRAVNEQGESDWTGEKSTAIGATPNTPSTWSSTNVCFSGEKVDLHWEHNCEDGCEQTAVDIYLEYEEADGTTRTETIELETAETHITLTLTTTSITMLYWYVYTYGVLGKSSRSPVSDRKRIEVYAQPDLTVAVADTNGNIVDTVTSFPLIIQASIGNSSTMQPISYHVSVVSNEIYESVDNVGNVKMVNVGEVVYSKYHDNPGEDFNLKLSAGDVDLCNNVNYTVNCSAVMPWGLTAEASTSFSVAWVDEEYSPNAEIGIDNAALTAHIHPYCEDAYGNLVNGVTLSVYRREYDGSFVELMTGIDNTKNVFITDPHPALDFARYRIVAISSSTGSVSFYDVPGYPVNESAVIIQWNEAWSDFNVTDESVLEQPSWSGSMLKLPYNIDVSDSNENDVSLIEYIGRKHPVSYYGTQRGIKSSWSVEIPMYDKDTLYALRRLAVWMGDVYVREPSGSGYWANISVSFSQKHLDLTIPVKLDIKRVEGGM